MNNLGLAFRDAGRYEVARELFEEALKRSDAVLGADNPDTLWAMGNLAGAYRDLGRLADAVSLSEKALKRVKKKLGADHPDTLRAMGNLADAYTATGRLSEAVPLDEAVVQGLKAKLGRDHAKTLIATNNLANAYIRAGKPDSAEPLLREALAIRESKTPDHWRTFETRVQLGASLVGQKKYAQAEPFLLAGYEGLKAREAGITGPSKNRLAEAGACVIDLYDAWGRKDKAVEWRRKIDTSNKP